jgi:hypothetical protein
MDSFSRINTPWPRPVIYCNEIKKDGAVLLKACTAPSFYATDLAKDLFLDRGKILFADPAQRALPVSREILKSRTGSNTGIRIANSRVVYIAANIADIFFHSSTPLHPDRFHFSQNRRNHSINNHSCFLL